MQFASWPLWCGVIYRCAFKPGVEMCQNLVSVGTSGSKKKKKKKRRSHPLANVFLAKKKIDKYLNRLEMRPWQVSGKCNGTFAGSHVRIQSGGKRHCLW